MAEGIKIRQLDSTSELEGTDVFVIDRVSQVDSTVSVTQNISYSDVVEDIKIEIDAFHPEDGTPYLILESKEEFVEFDVTVSEKTEHHRYYNYTDDEGDVASNKSFFLNGTEAPFLILVPGITYKFNVYDASNVGYELKFYTTSEGKGLGGLDKDIEDPVVTRVGAPGDPDAHIILELEENQSQLLFYVNDDNFYMGNQIFDAGSDTAFEIPDFGNPGFFPFTFTQQQYNNLINKDNDIVDIITSLQTKINDLEIQLANVIQVEDQ